MSFDGMEKKLMELLSPHATTTIGEIAKSLYVSETTARRYVRQLAERGLVIRTHGGCMPSSAALDSNTPMRVRFSSEQEDKHKIASRAAQMIFSGATVFLDSSSTAFHLVPLLRPEQGLTIITSGLKTAMALAERNIKVICLGGAVNPANLSMNTAFAMQSAEQFNADLFFFSGDALSDEGEVSDNSYEECLLRRALMRRADVSVLLIDPTKRGRRCRYNLCRLSDVDHCITVEGDVAVEMTMERGVHS